LREALCFVNKFFEVIISNRGRFDFELQESRAGSYERRSYDVACDFGSARHSLKRSSFRADR